MAAQPDMETFAAVRDDFIRANKRKFKPKKCSSSPEILAWFKALLLVPEWAPVGGDN